ncbi:MAG TPA: S8 family serine peptidase [Pyrinomonadaceae bacterium]
MFNNRLEIRVFGEQDQPLAGTVVTAAPEAAGNTADAQFDPTRQLYFFDGLRPGFYFITASHQEYEPETRRIQVHPKPAQAVFMLVKVGSSYTFRGNQRVPYDPQPELIGIIPSPIEEETVADADEKRGLGELLDSLGLVPEPVLTADEDAAEEGRARTPLVPGAMVVRRGAGPLDADNINELKVLREHPSVAAAGPVFRRSGNGFSVFTNQLFVKFKPEITRSAVERTLADEGLTLVRPLEFAPNLFVAEADASIGEAINQIAERLLGTGRVEYAEPQMAEVPELDSITPTDYLWPGTWDRQLVQTQDAWQLLRDDPALGESFQFGRPSIIIGVVDGGIRSVGGVPENPDFQGTVSDGSSKTYQLFDCGSLALHNDNTSGNHGISCAGIATGIANNPSADPSVGIGVAGAAPNARLIGLKASWVELWDLEMYLWAAGLHPQSARPGFPAPINPGADIFTCSLGLGSGAPLSQAAADMFDYITSRGRGGKGCVAVFSTGNDNSMHVDAPNWYRPYGTYERTFACAASTLSNTGVEIRGSGGIGPMAWCTPSNRGGTHNPPNGYRTWTVAFKHQGNMPSFPMVTTTLAANVAAGATSITVANTAGLTSQMYILLEPPGAPGSEPVMITGAPNPATGQVPVNSLLNSHVAGDQVIAGSRLVSTLTAPAAIGATNITVGDVTGLANGQRILLGAAGTLLWNRVEVTVTGDPDPGTGNVPVSALSSAWPVGTEVVVGNNHHSNDFGGTSSATPLSAGIVALVLSARPELTWVEVREILRNTAVKIDTANVNPEGRWLDANGDPSTVTGLPPVFSQWYGYGRLDANAAVAAALAYDFPRDLMIRDTLADDGVSPTAASADSPDIWVRTADPATDPGALPAGYGSAGPHQTPSFDGQRWLYARVRNRGTVESLDAWVRFSVASSDGTPFVHPDDWEPRNGLGNIAPGSWQPGTYFIGEVALPHIPAGGDFIVNIPWPDALVPPPLTPTGDPWNYHLLAEVTPQDGPLTGTLTNENNNLAQKAINIIDTTPPVVVFLDSSGNPMPHTAAVPSSTPSIIFPLRIRVTDRGFFDAESVTFDITWYRRGGAPTTITYARTAASWTPSAAPPTTVTISNPVNGAGTPANGNVAEAIFNGNLVLTGEFKQVRIQVNVGDLSGNVTLPANASRLIDVATPTDLALLLDYSGSMLAVNAAGQSKWNSAKEAANLFNTIYAALAPSTLDERIALVRFFTDGAAGPDLTEVTEGLSAPTTAAPLVDDPDPASANFWTPMGSAVLAGHGELAPAAPNWRNRVMILMTDGLENRNPMLADVRSAPAASPNFVPNVAESAQLGYVIHACAFGPPGQVDTGAIQNLALGGDGLKSYGGQLHSTETTADVNQAFALKEHFLSLLADTLPVEVIGPFASNFTIEPGVSEVVCVVTDNVAFNVTPPPEHVSPIGAVNTQPGFSWVRISDPAPGLWSLGGFAASATVQGFAVVDLVLQTSFDAGRTGIGVGLPISLSAEIRENGVGVSDATVTVEVEGPSGSIGQLLTSYTRTATFNPVRWQSHLSASARLEPLSLRRQMLVAASEEAGLVLGHARSHVVLTETTTPGRYEGAWLNTLEEGTYTFRFKARGQTASGAPFQRSYLISRHLEPLPEPSRTSLSWASVPIREKKIVRWKATLVPQTATGRPLGPGLAHKLSFQVAGRAASTQTRTPRESLATVEHKSASIGTGQEALIKVSDNLDGTYSAELNLPAGEAPPPLALRFGSHRITLLGGPTLCRRVRITLKRIKVIDDQETWFPSPGEMVFDVVVAPNGDPDRATRRRIPDAGHIRLSDGESQELNTVVFDGYVEDGATLDFSMGGTEYDWLLFFTKKDPLARYRRVFTGSASSWAKSYTPDDEADDPEALDDWQLWYDVEVF